MYIYTYLHIHNYDELSIHTIRSPIYVLEVGEF